MSFLHSSPILNRIVVLSAAQIASPTASQLADYSVTYMLDEAPYTRYVSNGTILLQIQASVSPTPVDQMLFTGYTEAQLTAQAVAGTLTQYASYVPSDTGHKFWAPDDSSLLLEESTFVYAGSPQFAGYWDGVNSDSTAITAAATYAASFSPRKNIMLPPLVGAGSSVSIPMNVHVLGYGYSPGKAVNTTIIPIAGATFSTGFFLNLNTSDGINATETGDAWDVGARCGLFGVFFDNTTNDIAGARLCVFAGAHMQAEDVWGFYAVQLIKQATSAYADNVVLKRICSNRSLDNSEYMIELGSSSAGGDCASLEDLYFSPNELNGGPELSVKISQSNCGSIRNMINGAISIVGGASVTIDNWHSEAAQLIVSKGAVSLRDSTLELKDGATYYPIDLTTTAGNGVYPFVIENTVFKYGLSGREGNSAAEIRTTRYHTITVRNSYKGIYSANAVGTVGLRINNSSDVAIGGWNRNAGFLSANGVLSNLVASGIYEVPMAASDFGGITGTLTKVTGYGSSTFVNSTTYYYKSQLLLDSVKMVGLNQTGAEASTTMSATVANTQRISGSITSTGGAPALATIRFYRGTSSGSYDKYCDVPSVNCLTMQDIGDYVNGLPWVARGAGAVDTITETLGTYKITPASGAFLTTAYENNPNLNNDADATIGSPAALVNNAVIVSAITADRSYTIHSGITTVGSRVTLVRNNGATGAFNANFKNPAGTTLKALATSNTWATAELCYGSVWRLVAYGAL
jgi:hypothetical protein